MSELINNRKERQEKLKALILRLHDGEAMESVKKDFEKEFGQIAASEISAMEQALVADGLPISDIQRLCDVHSSVFKGSIEQIHASEAPEHRLWHPVAFLKEENRKIESVLEETVEPALQGFLKQSDDPSRQVLAQALVQLESIDRHYLKKENLLFSFLEKHDITAPPKVMWGVDDDIRQLLKEAKAATQDRSPHEVKAAVEACAEQVREMIFKEENILFPMALETLVEDEWRQIARDSREIGFILNETPPPFPGGESDTALPDEDAATAMGSDEVRFPSGRLTPDQVRLLLNTLPLDMTFVGADDTVLYFSQGKDRIFERSPSIIGRKVVNCHPPASMHVVEQILDDFKSGRRDEADFWIRMGGKYVYIRYFAVRDDEGAYAGTLEVTQDIAPIQNIEGEKRLLDEPR